MRCNPEVCGVREVTKCNPEVLRARFADCFVGLSFPQVPVFIILSYFESPATTFGLVKVKSVHRGFRLQYYIRKVLEICEKLTLLDIIFIIYLDWKYKSKYIRVYKKKCEE